MFNSLRQGNLFYVLDKANLDLKVGEVQSVCTPKPIYGQSMFQPHYGQPETEIDIKVKIGDSIQDFTQLPSAQSVALKNNIFVTDNKDAMNAEIEAMLRSSRQAIESVPYHEKVVTACDAMLRELNPQFAKEKIQEEKIGALEEKMGGIENTLTQMMGLLSDAIGHNKSIKKNKED